MAKKSSGNKAVLNWKRKKWYQIIAPKLFNEQTLGETMALEADLVMGRTTTLNLMTITKDIKKQNVKVSFKVNDIKGLKAYTEFTAYQMIPASIKRLVRKGREKISDSFTAVSKDGKNIRIKPLIICQNTVTHSVGTDIREATKKMTTEILKQIPYHTFVRDVITGKFQRALRQQLSKIYPTRIAEIRAIKLIE